MLSRLYVRNFALIEAAEIEFSSGFNVITGETGAGKSILIGALNCILGQRADSAVLRQGADSCVVEALFEFDPGDPLIDSLTELGAPPEEDQLVIRRQIQSSGRWRATVNGLTVPARLLRQIGALLIDLHGQHQHQSLFDTGQHAGFLDAYGALQPLADRVAGLYRRLGEADRQLEAVEAEAQRLSQEEELRRFQLEEIRSLDPLPDEEEKLQGELQVLDNLEELGSTARDLDQTLYQTEGSIAEQLDQARRRLERAADTDPELRRKADVLADLVFSIEDLASSLRDYSERLDADPDRLAQKRDRLDALQRLRHKHGGSLEDIIALADDLEKQENRAGSLAGQIAELQANRQGLEKNFTAACLKLSDGRRRAAQRLARAAAAEMAQVGMRQAAFDVALARRPSPQGRVETDGQRFHADASGMEQVEFYIAANAGHPPRPLAAIASGGEISRVMLVLKSLIADRRTVPTLVFDEIDVGISGRVAATVGKRLERLSHDHQTLIVTHLPQIASLAHRHFAVRKRQTDGETQTRVFQLDTESRTEEIAHLLAGETVSDTARRHAREMLG
jgi:DNA repair protein RecN (Recombination protein N)